jgi:ribonuclease H
MSADYPSAGIATDAAHSSKNGITAYRAVDLSTGKELFHCTLGNQTVNIGEFLGVVAAIRYIIENHYSPPVIYTDSLTAITWVNNKKTASKKPLIDLYRAEVFLKVMASEIESILIVHWDTKSWGETPADFGNK